MTAPGPLPTVSAPPIEPEQPSRWVRALGMLTDLLLWCLLLGLIAWGIYYLTVKQYEGHQQTIHLAFQDANEIGRGAAVHMMGTDIGYVDDIHMRGDYVDVVVKTYPNSLTIPSGSTFTILFTGLVGSKSIEIVPPATPRPLVQGKPQYLVKNPIRLRQALQYQIDIADSLKEGAENFANMFGNDKPAEILQYNVLKARDGIIIARNYLTDFNVLLEQKNKDAGMYLGNIRHTIEDFAEATAEADRTLDPRYLGPTVSSALRYFNLAVNEGHAAMETFESTHGFHQFNRKIIDANRRISHTSLLTPEVAIHKLQAWNRHVRAFGNGLSTFNRYLSPSPLPHLEAMDRSLKSFNQQVEKANRRL